MLDTGFRSLEMNTSIFWITGMPLSRTKTRTETNIRGYQDRTCTSEFRATAAKKTLYRSSEVVEASWQMTCFENSFRWRTVVSSRPARRADILVLLNEAHCM